MKVYDAPSIRNVALVGHGGCGKTSLASAMLFDMGAVNRLGRVDDGTTVTDFDPDEIERKISLQTGLAFGEWRKIKINLLDAPGYANFLPEARAALRVADAAIVVVDAVAGVEVQTEKVWGYAEEYALPRLIVVNRMDRERASFVRTLESLERAFGRGAVPLAIPLGEEKGFVGVTDLLTEKADVYTDDQSGKFQAVDVPEEYRATEKALRDKLVEMVAESNEALMEEFFEKGTLPQEDLREGPAPGGAGGPDLPGLPRLLGAQRGDPAPARRDRGPLPVSGGPRRGGGDRSRGQEGDDAPARRRTRPSPPSSSRPSPTPTPAASRSSASTPACSSRTAPSTTPPGTWPSAWARWSSSRARPRRRCRRSRPATSGRWPSSRRRSTGDTLCDKAHPIVYPPLVFPEPATTFAIEPKTRGDEDKISAALHRLMEEDPVLRLSRDAQTHEMLLSGMGQLHIEVVVGRLKKRYKVEVNLKKPKIPYRETIKAAAEGHGRHKKQTGGHGQFGDCKIRMKPLPRGSDFKFVDDIFGGSIPKNFIPAVEKGIQDARMRGFVAGFPMVDFQVELFDGQYHDVDSSEMSFKIAGSLAFKDAVAKCRPTLLEPVMKVEIAVPEEYAGSVMGDLSSRRGRPQGMEPKGSLQVVQAEVPLVGDALLRRRADLHDRRARLLPHGDGPLRRGPRPPAGEDHRRRPGRARRRQGAGVTWKA